MAANKNVETVKEGRAPAARILVVSGVCLSNGDTLARYLSRLLGLSDDDYELYLDRATLCFEKWHSGEARQSAKKIWSSLYGKNTTRRGYDVLVLLGSKVREIFARGSVGHVDYFGYRIVAGCKVVSLPLPSELSNAWNGPLARARAVSVMSAVAPWVPWEKRKPMSSPKFGAAGFWSEASKETLPEERASEAIGDVAAEMYRIAAAHGFHEKHVQGQVPEDFGAFCMNLVGEVSELWEAFREGRLDVQCDKKCGLTCAEEELADVVIRSMDTAVQLGVDLGRAVALKTAYNRTRPYRHGNKRA